jgi:hypothetical protein
MSKEKEIPFKASVSLFAAEDAKREELKKSSEVVDQLTAVLMEPHAGEPFTDECDSTGLWYNFAMPKAIAIMKRFHVKARTQEIDQSDSGSSNA